MSKRSREWRHYKGVLAPAPPASEAEPPATREARIIYAIVAGVANTLLAVAGAGFTGLAVGFSGFGSGRGWEAVAAISLVAWLGGLSGVLAITRNVFLGEALPIASAVGGCIVATIVAFTLGWGLVGGNVITFLLVACASAAATYVVSAP